MTFCFSYFWSECWFEASKQPLSGIYISCKNSFLICYKVKWFYLHIVVWSVQTINSLNIWMTQCNNMTNTSLFIMTYHSISLSHWSVLSDCGLHYRDVYFTPLYIISGCIIYKFRLNNEQTHCRNETVLRFDWQTDSSFW